MQAGMLDAYSTYLYHQGNNSHSYMLFGAHQVSQDGGRRPGTFKK